MFVLSLIHEKNSEECLFYIKTVLIENQVNRESKILELIIL